MNQFKSIIYVVLHQSLSEKNILTIYDWKIMVRIDGNQDNAAIRINILVSTKSNLKIIEYGGFVQIGQRREIIFSDQYFRIAQKRQIRFGFDRYRFLFIVFSTQLQCGFVWNVILQQLGTLPYFFTVRNPDFCTLQQQSILCIIIRKSISLASAGILLQGNDDEAMIDLMAFKMGSLTGFKWFINIIWIDRNSNILFD